jgi:hypothetical protein
VLLLLLCCCCCCAAATAHLRVMVRLVCILHVMYLTVNLLEEVKAVEEDFGEVLALEHVEDRDEAGGGPSVAEVVGLDELFYNLF